MDPTAISPAYVQTFVLMAARIGPALFTMPVLNSPSLPATLRVGIAAVLTYIFLPIQSRVQPAPVDLLPFAVMLAQEAIVGLAIGFVATSIYSAIQMAGQVVGMQTGLSLASALDPTMASETTSPVDQLYAVTAALTFLAIDGHHQVMLAVRRSFELVPIGTYATTGALQLSLIDFTAGLFAIALRIALPIVAMLLFVSAAGSFKNLMTHFCNIFE